MLYPGRKIILRDWPVGLQLALAYCSSSSVDAKLPYVKQFNLKSTDKRNVCNWLSSGVGLQEAKRFST